MICNGKNKCGHHIEGSELLFKQKVEADCHDYCIANHTYLLEQFPLEDTAEGTGKQADAALVDKNRNKGEDYSVAEGCAKDDCVNEVECGFYK